MSKQSTIWLVGMMGAGKTTIGPLLAKRLGCAYVDSDCEVEKDCGVSLVELFRTQGEEIFRRHECAVIARLSGLPLVVALGGGAIAQPGAGTQLAETGRIVYLRTRPETLNARLAGGGERPLLAGCAPEERLARLRVLLADREPYYAAAHVIVDTDERSAEEVVEQILGALVEA